jgi:UPF0042 nucleotide-binding protein
MTTRKAIGAGPSNVLIKVVVESFGHRHGPIPTSTHIVLDLRTCLPDPTTDPDIRALTGLYPKVHAHMLALPGAGAVLAGLGDLTVALYHLHDPRLKRVNVAIGSTWGRHRSVALANALTRTLNDQGIPTEVTHRDILHPLPGE